MLKKLVGSLLGFKEDRVQDVGFEGAPGFDLRPLSELREGEHAIVATVLSTGKVAKRLSELGFVKGAKVVVAAKPRFGPLKVMLKGSCLAIGAGVASRIFTSE